MKESSTSKQQRRVVRVKRRVRASRPKSLNDMGIKTEEDYWRYVNDCLAGHASIYQ